MSAPIAVAYGGGVNSTAMLVEMRRRDIVPVSIVFSDTHGERPETYAGIDQTNKWCVAHDFPEIVVVSYVSKMRGNETLEENCLRTKSLPSIAYGFKSCSEKFKIRPQERYLKSQPWAQSVWESGGKVIKAIGYDAGEDRRAKIREHTDYTYWYPLIEWDLYREDCKEICEHEGLKIGKSACFFCPSSKKPEVLLLAKEHPDLMKRALEMEANAELTTVKGLGRHWSWDNLLKLNKEQMSLFCDSGTPEEPCGCYDG
jgi:hypothetical protein